MNLYSPVSQNSLCRAEKIGLREGAWYIYLQSTKIAMDEEKWGRLKEESAIDWSIKSTIWKYYYNEDSRYRWLSVIITGKRNHTEANREIYRKKRVKIRDSDVLPLQPDEEVDARPSNNLNRALLWEIASDGAF